MAYSINVTKRTNGGFTIATEDYTYYASAIVYHGTAVGVTLYSRGLTTKLYKPTEWTIQTVTGFTTIAQVCDALDTLGVVSGDPLSDMVTLLTTIDGDTGNIVTDVSAIKTALEIIDDWDESDRAKVNIIAGQVGVDSNSGNKSDKTIRNVIATDQPELTNPLKVKGSVSTPAALVASGTPQNVTTGWVDFGAEITTNGAHTLALWAVVTHTNSVNNRVRILGKHTATTGAEFLIPIKTISSTDVKVNGHYYELDSDATQNVVLDWDISAVPYVQVQIQCETVGSTADTISGDYTLMF